MLRWLTLILGCALPVMVVGQEVVCTPFDNNGDNIVGIGDLIDLLARFGDSDLDQDGIWDSADDCVGAYDTCGVCNGPGPQVLAIDTIVITFDSIYVDAIDEWLTYEMSRDTLLHLVCENPGCTDPDADNYDPYTTEENGTCAYTNGAPVCDYATAVFYHGYTYSLVAIGNQCWFAENLRNTLYSNGDSIPRDLSEDDWEATFYGASAIFDNDTSYLSQYGRLYNWYATIDASGLCPLGWHVPTDGEWTDLESYITSHGFAGSEGVALKSATGWDGTDNFGFGALPGGSLLFTGESTEGYPPYFQEGTFWTSTSAGSSDARYRGFDSGDPEIYSSGTANGYDRRAGMSVRCIRNSE